MMISHCKQSLKPKLLLIILSLTSLLYLPACSQHQPVPVVDIGQRPFTATQYEVQKGDTLFAIAFRFDLNLKGFAQHNHLRPPYTIYPGQLLNLNDRGISRNAKKTVPKAANKASKVQKSSVGKVSQKAGAQASALKGNGVQAKPANVSSQSSVKQPTIASRSKQQIKSSRNDKGWRWPIAISSKGKIIQKFAAAKKLNKGIDIAAPLGSPIVSSRSGTVVYAGSRLKGYGKLIIVKHDESFLSAYAHNQSILVKEGDWVKQGQKIATLGQTAAARPKLHFEIRKQGKPVDPLHYLAR